MASAAAILPPSPPPAPVLDSEGVYKMTKNTVVDTSAATFTICALEADLTVPSGTKGSASFVAELSGKADGCLLCHYTFVHPYYSPTAPQPNPIDPHPVTASPTRCRTSNAVDAPNTNDMVIETTVSMNQATPGAA